MAGLPNGISCTNGQHTEGKSVHMFPLKEKDRKRHLAWVRFVRRHRPKWSSTNSYFLCSDHFDDSCFKVDFHSIVFRDRTGTERKINHMSMRS